MQKKLFFVVSLFFVFACDPPKKETHEAALPPVDVPPSYLGVRVSLPAEELEAGINSVLPDQLINGAFPMKDDRDSLFLMITRNGHLDLKISHNEIFASIPLNITVSVKRRLLGVTFSNKDTPITFSGRVKASTEVSLEDDWELGFVCSWDSFEFDDDPVITFMGMKFNVENTINDVVNDYRDNLSDMLCRSLRESISLKKALHSVWEDLQATHRIARNPRPLFLRSSPVAMSGVLVPGHDALAVHLEYRSSLHISPENRIMVNKLPLGERTDPLSTNPVFIAYPELTISYPFLQDALSDVIKGETFEYDRYTATITSVLVSRRGQELNITLTTEGDLKGVIHVSGKPSLNDQLQFGLENFQYQMEAENKWVNMTDFAIHQFIEEYLSQQVSIDLSTYFHGLDELIMTSISNSDLGEKLDLRVSFDHLATHNLVLTETGIQWVLMVEGSSSIELKQALINGRRR